MPAQESAPGALPARAAAAAAAAAVAAGGAPVAEATRARRQSLYIAEEGCVWAEELSS